MHDQFRKKYRLSPATARLRRQIALEAARRLFESMAPVDEENQATRGGTGAEAGTETAACVGTDLGWLDAASEGAYYAAKRKAAAVLGHRVRPGDLPSDSEVREQLVSLTRSRSGAAYLADESPEPADDDEIEPAAEGLGARLDRFAVYKLRLEPLEAVKQNPRHHPEGDALYHSLQVFELARQVRPYDEEFLLAALLHDVGKAIDMHGHAAAGVAALSGSITERTAWLIAHHMDLLVRDGRSLSSRVRRAIEASPHGDDLKLLRELDDAGRVAGAPVGTIDQALDYIRGLEREAYLEAGDAPPANIDRPPNDPD